MHGSLDAVATRATINAGGVRDWSPLRTLPNKEHRFDPVVVEGGPFATKERERAKEAVLQAQRRMGDRDGSLDLSYCLLGDVVERALPPFLTLLKLNLTSCGLTPPAMEKVAAALQRGFAGTGLTFLRVSHNPRLGDAGLVHLAGALPPTLDTLQLTNVGCGDEGMVALAQGLPTLPGLVELAVQSNPDVGEAGFSALGAALPALPKLVRLHCHACTGMGCAGLAGLAKGLPEAGALEDLDISQCGIGPGGVKVLTPLVEEVPALRTLFCSENPGVSTPTLEMLRAAMPRRRGAEAALHVY